MGNNPGKEKSKVSPVEVVEAKVLVDRKIGKETSASSSNTEVSRGEDGKASSSKTSPGTVPPKSSTLSTEQNKPSAGSGTNTSATATTPIDDENNTKENGSGSRVSNGGLSDASSSSTTRSEQDTNSNQSLVSISQSEIEKTPILRQESKTGSGHVNDNRNHSKETLSQMLPKHTTSTSSSLDSHIPRQRLDRKTTTSTLSNVMPSIEEMRQKAMRQRIPTAPSETPASTAFIRQFKHATGVAGSDGTNANVSDPAGKDHVQSAEVVKRLEDISGELNVKRVHPSTSRERSVLEKTVLILKRRINEENERRVKLETHVNFVYEKVLRYDGRTNIHSKCCVTHSTLSESYSHSPQRYLVLFSRYLYETSVRCRLTYFYVC